MPRPAAGERGGELAHAVGVRAGPLFAVGGGALLPGRRAPPLPPPVEQPAGGVRDADAVPEIDHAAGGDVVRVRAPQLLHPDLVLDGGRRVRRGRRRARRRLQLRSLCPHVPVVRAVCFTKGDSCHESHHDAPKKVIQIHQKYQLYQGRQHFIFRSAFFTLPQ